MQAGSVRQMMIITTEDEIKKMFLKKKNWSNFTNVAASQTKASKDPFTRLHTVGPAAM